MVEQPDSVTDAVNIVEGFKSHCMVVLIPSRLTSGLGSTAAVFIDSLRNVPASLNTTYSKGCDAFHQS